MKRIAIFSFYDKDGVVDEYVDYLLTDLLTVIDKLVIVANGKINDEGRTRIKHLTTDIYIRENMGYDSGAYKDCMFNYLGIGEIQKYDELILCNDTCFGPFVSFKDIFGIMSKRKCDFWSMKQVEWRFLSHIQSWFLVFKKNIINNDQFYKYWNENIDECCKDIYDVYYNFEMKIYRYLMQLGYTPDTYSKNRINGYTSCYYALKNGEVFLKKKFFDSEKNLYGDMCKTVEYIKANYEYPYELIYQAVKRKYDIDLCKYECVDDNTSPCEYYPLVTWTEDEFINKLSQYRHIFLYGAGHWASMLFYYMNDINKSISGVFVTSPGSQNSFRGMSVREWGKDKLDDEDGIVVAMNYTNSIGLYKQLGDCHNIIYLWDVKKE